MGQFQLMVIDDDWNAGSGSADIEGGSILVTSSHHDCNQVCLDILLILICLWNISIWMWTENTFKYKYKYIRVCNLTLHRSCNNMFHSFPCWFNFHSLFKISNWMSHKVNRHLMRRWMYIWQIPRASRFVPQYVFFVLCMCVCICI